MMRTTLQTKGLSNWLRRTAGAAVLLAAAAATAEPVKTDVFPGDQHWMERAAGATGSNALAGPVDLALEAYQSALKENESNLDARWRLMRAYYFKAEYTTADPEQKKRIFDEGKKAGEEALRQIRSLLGKKHGRTLEKASPVELASLASKDLSIARCFLWAGVNWGKWSLVFGKTAAVKQGAAAKIRDYATAVIAIDPALDDAGGYRLLGRLHHQTPAVPFLTGWASRDEALKNLREAVKLAPNSLINKQYLAEALWDYEKARRSEARALLESVLAAQPAPDFLIEDRRTQDEVRGTLATWSRS